jgi:hypothetical protein
MQKAELKDLRVWQAALHELHEAPADQHLETADTASRKHVWELHVAEREAFEKYQSHWKALWQ